MTIPHLIPFIIALVWILIPFKQVKTKYFLFFLIYAVTAIFLLIDFFLLIHPAKIYLGQGFFLIISLFDFKKIPHYIIFLLSVLIISVILPFVLSINTITVILIIQHIILFAIILKRIIIYSNENKKLNIFQFVVLIYELALITRSIVVLGDTKTGLIFFYISAAFGIIPGIFFLFYNEKTSPAIYLEKKSIQP